MNTNPFNITKAVDYTDEQIYNYWVDLPHSGFSEILKPTSPMPMIILGAKGSGKTHIMRYFSFSLQSLRFGDIPLIDGIKKDGYIGIYMRCSGLNADRFSGKSQTKEAWKTVYSFYMELWLSQLLLTSITKINFFKDQADVNLEFKITQRILQQFDKLDIKNEITNLETLSLYLKELQKKVDYEINNCALTGKSILDIEITITPGKLVFGIPQILVEFIQEIDNIKFLYLLDEFENLTEYQQQYINTLIREKEDPVTFKIGSRLYGLRTLKTFSAEEELKEGSEYEKYNIDQIFRDREPDYKEFVTNICIKRLNKHGYSIEKDLNGFFQKADVKTLNVKDRDELKYFKDLEKKLNGYPNDKISEIISNLKFEDDLLLERTNILLFYRHWKKTGGDLVQMSKKINTNCIEYFKSKNPQIEHHIVLDKYKNDIIDQLYREIYSDVPYTGFSSFIKMSAGIPKNLLIILKHVFRWSNFNGELPFKIGNKISIKSQVSGLKDASEWFLEDSRIICDDPRKVRRSFDKIGRFLQEIRFSNIPPECSISTFSLMLSSLNSESQKIIEYLEQYSYFIRVNQRRDKNTNRRDVAFQINGIIAPYWELSLQRRGVVQLGEKEIKAIFELDNEDEFNKILNIRLSEYNAPFQLDSLKLF
jgi:hypothetical protein